jgi:hypothetical protein
VFDSSKGQPPQNLRRNISSSYERLWGIERLTSQPAHVASSSMSVHIVLARLCFVSAAAFEKTESSSQKKKIFENFILKIAQFLSRQTSEEE